MSATRDKNQKVTFIYKNFHQIFKQGQEPAPSAGEVRVNSPLNPSGQVLKVEDLNSPMFGVVKVQSHKAPEFISKRVVARPAVLPTAVRPSPIPNPKISPDTFPTNPAIESLKGNLKSLNDLHARLRFMLQELEELVKEDDKE